MVTEHHINAFMAPMRCWTRWSLAEAACAYDELIYGADAELITIAHSLPNESEKP